ncbi:hypothetical protein E3J79_01215 [Candidatus Dependentiae bacterium]|nr:MAG: hypothetical protein E3J79_01215 [Candidatus Dependentiae bacterium]
MKKLLFLLVVSLTAHAMHEKGLDYLKLTAKSCVSENEKIELTASQKKYLEKVLQYGLLYKSEHYTDCELITCIGGSILGFSGAVSILTPMILNSNNPSHDMFDGVSLGLLTCSTIGCLGSIGVYMRRYLRSKKQSEKHMKYIGEGMNTLGSQAMTIKKFLERERQGFCPIYCLSCRCKAGSLCMQPLTEGAFREYCKKCSLCKVAYFQGSLGLKKEKEKKYYNNYEEGYNFLMTVLSGILKKTETGTIV